MHSLLSEKTGTERKNVKRAFKIPEPSLTAISRLLESQIYKRFLGIEQTSPYFVPISFKIVTLWVTKHNWVVSWWARQVNPGTSFDRIPGRPQQTMKRKIKISENLCSIRNDTNCPLGETLSVYKRRPFLCWKERSALVAEIFFRSFKRNGNGRTQGEIKKERKSESDNMKFLILTRWLSVRFYRRLSEEKGSQNHRNDVPRALISVQHHKLHRSGIKSESAML